MATNTNTIKTRVQLKSDTEENWNKAGPKDGSVGFVPLLGELIVYTSDDAHPFSRLKIGDGQTNVISLPFIDAGTINGDILPEDEVLTYEQKQLFPSPGIENKLYIDLSTNTIYCYKDLGGYTQLSNWTYQIQKSTVSRITNWNVGAITEVRSQEGILQITDGILPTLDYYNTEVVSNVTRSES